MGWLRNRALVVLAGMALLAGTLGASLGLVAALQTTTLYEGVNYKGPLLDAVTPAKFVSCLGDNWSGVYLWDTAQGRWFHYFPEGTGQGQVPAWVNSPAAGGFNLIPRARGVALIMNDDMPTAHLPDRPTDVCP